MVLSSRIIRSVDFSFRSTTVTETMVHVSCSGCVLGPCSHPVSSRQHASTSTVNHVKTKVTPHLVLPLTRTKLPPRPACAIQSCLSRTSYDQSKCEAYVAALYRCCDQFYKAVDQQSVTNLAGVERPDVVESTACPIRRAVERKMKQLEKEGR